MYNYHDKSFGEKISEARAHLGYSLRDVAERAKISASQLSKLERNMSLPHRNTVIYLAEALELDRNEMLITAGYSTILPNQMVNEELAPYINDTTSNLNIPELYAKFEEPTEETVESALRRLVDQEATAKKGRKLATDEVIAEITEQLKEFLDFLIERKIRKGR